ncbi:hypothetical protein [Psychrobacter sp. VH5]|uniref:hypothetical protein n=1 Tax=Psychrobacter sp. VH5 TaxID=3423439 RepID=UPI003D64C4BE
MVQSPREKAWDALIGYTKKLDSAVGRLVRYVTIPATGSEMNSGGVKGQSR